MASTLVATPKAINANSYATIAEIDVVLGDRLAVDAWDEALLEQRTRAALWATTLLDRRVHWKGTRRTTAQALHWPRNGVIDFDTGTEFDADTIPAFLVEATAVYALFLLETLPTTAGELAGVQSVKMGDLSVSFGGRTTVRADAVPLAVREIIQHYGIILPGQQVPVRRA